MAGELLRRCGWAAYLDPETKQHWYCTLQEPSLCSWTPPWEFIMAQMVAPDLARLQFTVHPLPLEPSLEPPPPDLEPPPLHFTAPPPALPGVPPPPPIGQPPPLPGPPPQCPHHSQLSWDGKPWPVGGKVQIWEGNILDSQERLSSLWSMMDDRIFSGDKTGWWDCWPIMSRSFHLFEWTRMGATSGGYCGASAQCLNCKRICRIRWDSYTPELELEAGRAKWLCFFGCRYNVPGDPNAVRVR